MSKIKKEKTVGFRLTKEALDILDRVTQEQGITRTAALELAIRKVWGKHEPNA